MIINLYKKKKKIKEKIYRFIKTKFLLSHENSLAFDWLILMRLVFFFNDAFNIPEL